MIEEQLFTSFQYHFIDFNPYFNRLYHFQMSRRRESFVCFPSYVML